MRSNGAATNEAGSNYRIERTRIRRRLRWPHQLARSCGALDRVLMLKHITAAALLSAPVGAADFRALDFGESCIFAKAYELRLGSFALLWTPNIGPDVHAFKGREFDRELLIMYGCHDGKLIAGDYFFPLEELNTVVDTYRDTRQLMILTNGEPYLDNTPWLTGSHPGVAHWIESNPSKYWVIWRTPRILTSMRILPHFTSEESGWRVTINVSRTGE